MGGYVSAVCAAVVCVTLIRKNRERKAVSKRGRGLRATRRKKRDGMSKRERKSQTAAETQRWRSKRELAESQRRLK